MADKNLNRLVAAFLDGDLSAEEEKQALHKIAEDHDSRQMLRFERFLSEEFSKELDPETFSVPAHFADDVMNEIYRVDAIAGEESGKSRIAQVIEQVNSWFQPKEFVIRPGLAAVLSVVVIATAAVFGLQDTVQETDSVAGNDSVEMISHNPADERVWIRFIYIDDSADNLAVAGDFSDWEPVTMDRQQVDGETVWTGMVPVQRGEHHYMFIKNGEEWVTDPLADVVRDDGFGNKNAVIYL